MSAILGEFIGSAALLLFGAGVVANVALNKTNGHQGGWIVITFGWAMAVFIGVYTSVHLGGSGHLNPAVTLAMTAFKGFDQSLVPGYIGAQLAGSFLGAVIVWVAYYKQFEDTTDADAKLAVFCTSPAINSPLHNTISEAIGAFALVFGALCLSPAASSLGTLDALPVSLLVLGIGLSLGGPTGYAINPSRDLGPRIAHFLLPISNKRDSNWKYSWVPIVGPIIGALAAGWVFSLL